jgi:hypothetical protein
MMIALLAALAVKAVVSQVTVFSDRARVVREAEVTVQGKARVELPLLPDSVDSGSIRVEAGGAEVQKVDIQHVEPDEFPAGEARALLGKLEKLDDELSLLADGQAQLQHHLAALRRISPEIKDEPLKARPRLNPKGWAESLAFAQEEEQAVRARIRDQAQKSGDLQRERQALAERARIIGGAGRRSGWRVTAWLEGKGDAHLTLTYLAAQARWMPGYDLQLLQDQKTVRVSFSGAASQETGEDWSDAALTLSTAIPATVRMLPEIATWKIGEQERFIPTPQAEYRRHLPPAPPSPQPVPAAESGSETLRRDLLARVEGRPPEQLPAASEEGESDKLLAGVVGGLVKEAPAAPSAMPQKPAREERKAKSRPPQAVAAAPPPTAAAAVRSRAELPGRAPAVPTEQVGISPPPSWRPPQMPPDSPSALAGGYDLEFPSVRRETLRSGGGARRVLLFTETWPVTTERLLFPALAPDAYLVAQIKNPSRRTLPRGEAALSVGADPAGNATLPLVAPGEELTLPLGIDRALRSFRNIAQVQSEKGLFSKDEVTRYAVSIEVANPYPVPVALRIVDQVPLQGDKNIEVELVEAAKAERDEATGKLTWRLSAPASGKVKVGFVYQLKRPKGYRVHQ